VAFTQAQLDAIEEAIASGATSVSYEGKTVSYQSLDQMLRIRAIIRSALGQTNPPVTVLAQHSRGFTGSNSESE
jgi:hypothetical protein